MGPKKRQFIETQEDDFEMDNIAIFSNYLINLLHNNYGCYQFQLSSTIKLICQCKNEINNKLTNPVIGNDTTVQNTCI